MNSKKAREIMREHQSGFVELNPRWCAIDRLIEDSEKLELEKYKKGKWIITKDYNGYETIIKDCKCPFCDVEALLKESYSMDGQRIVLYPSKYCPNCGAKLEVE